MKKNHIHPDATGALYSPDAGTITPYEYTIALAENAADNGVEVRIRREVVAIEPLKEGEGFKVVAKHWEPPAVAASEFGVSLLTPRAIIQLFFCPYSNSGTRRGKPCVPRGRA